MSITKKIGITIDADAKKAIQSFDEVAKKADAAQKATQKLGEFTSGPTGLSIKFNAMAEAASKAVQILQQAAQVIDNVSQRAMQVNNVFGNLAFGIEGARKATRGLISDFDLAVAANQAMSLGVTDNAKDFAQLAQAAQALGARINQGPKESLDSLMAALGRGSSMMLDNLGIVLKESEAHDIYAKQLGKTTSQLNENEKAEAFRKVAMQKIIEAAKGVSVETDNAAAAVQRFKIELQNIEDRALGAQDKTNSLSATLRDYVMANRVSEDSLRAHGSAVLELEIAMEDLGVSTTLLNKTSAEWIRLVKIAKIEAKAAHEEMIRWGRSAEGIAKISKELNAIQSSAQAHARGIIDKERLRDIERELALHGTQRGRMEEINHLLNEKAELTAKQLELEGKLSEAEEVRFQNELRQIRASTATSRGGGRRKNQWEGKEIGSMESRGSGIATAADRATFEEQLGPAQMARAGKDSAAKQEEFQLRESERVRKEANAEFDKLHAAEMQRTKDEAAATKAAEEEKRREIEETMRKRMQVAQASQTIASNMISIGALAADGFIKGEKRREAAAQRAAGIQSITIGILETVKAVAAFAGFNYVEGAMHTAAAALAYAQGGALLAKAGAGGGGGPRAANSGFASGSAFGPGDTGPAANGPSGGVGAPTAPISEQGVQRSGRGGMHGGTANQQQGRGDTYQITVLGSMSQRDVINLRRQLDDSKGVTRRVGHRG